MAKVIPGRMTGTIDGDFVVFLIGMRVNKPWKLHKWIPVARAMGPMLRELSKQKELGLMGYHLWVGPTGPMVVQYWRSVEHLEAFARESSLPHRPAWRAYNASIGSSGDVGVWHETYLVPAGAYENVYANMPAFGLARAGAHVPVVSGMHNSSQRRVSNAAAGS